MSVPSHYNYGTEYCGGCVTKKELRSEKVSMALFGCSNAVLALFKESKWKETSTKSVQNCVKLCNIIHYQT